MVMWNIVCEIMQRPTIWGIMSELSTLMAPLWAAVVVGVLVGWAWKPKWASIGSDTLDCSVLSRASSTLLAKADESSSKLEKTKSLPLSLLRLDSLKFQLPSFSTRLPTCGISNETSSAATNFNSEGRRLETENKESLLSDKDFDELYNLVEEKDGGPAWIPMMNRSTGTMTYQAWRRDRDTGPPQYRSSTIYEDVTPELLKDFFWDDEFRSQWDDMLIHAETLEESSTKGSFVVKWVRKFPFFCSDREYVIGRRIWEFDGVYYCVTKGVPNSVARQSKPRRVDLYYSSWCIRAAEGKHGAGEVLLFHYEDMGIPWEIAKLGVRQGMWGAVKKIEPGLRAYQKYRASGSSMSRCAHLAQITTKITKDHIGRLELSRGPTCEADSSESPAKPTRNIPRLVIIGGAVALACTLDRGLATKAVIFGVARKLAKVGKRL